MTNPFLTFLEKVGQGIIKYLPLALGVGTTLEPLVSAANPTAGTTLDKFDTILTSALSIEQSLTSALGTSGLTAAQRIAALEPQIANIVAQSQIVIAHKIANQTLFTQAMNEYAQATIDLLNSLEGQNGTTVVGSTTITTPISLKAVPVSPVKS